MQQILPLKQYMNFQFKKFILMELKNILGMFYIYSINRNTSRPLEFSDHVAKLAHKIEWRTLVGNNASLDNPNAQIDDDDDDDDNATTTNVETKRSRIATTNDVRRLTDTGPWHNVAKCLQ
jgi:hypothetical protein